MNSGRAGGEPGLFIAEVYYYYPPPMPRLVIQAPRFTVKPKPLDPYTLNPQQAPIISLKPKPLGP